MSDFSSISTYQTAQFLSQHALEPDGSLPVSSSAGQILVFCDVQAIVHPHYRHHVGDMEDAMATVEEGAGVSVRLTKRRYVLSGTWTQVEVARRILQDLPSSAALSNRSSVDRTMTGSISAHQMELVLEPEKPLLAGAPPRAFSSSQVSDILNGWVKVPKDEHLESDGDEAPATLEAAAQRDNDKETNGLDRRDELALSDMEQSGQRSKEEVIKWRAEVEEQNMLASLPTQMENQKYSGSLNTSEAEVELQREDLAMAQDDLTLNIENLASDELVEDSSEEVKKPPDYLQFDFDAEDKISEAEVIVQEENLRENTGLRTTDELLATELELLTLENESKTLAQSEDLQRDSESEDEIGEAESVTRIQDIHVRDHLQTHDRAEEDESELPEEKPSKEPPAAQSKLGVDGDDITKPMGKEQDGKPQETQSPEEPDFLQVEAAEFDSEDLMTHLQEMMGKNQTEVTEIEAKASGDELEAVVERKSSDDVASEDVFSMRLQFESSSDRQEEAGKNEKASELVEDDEEFYRDVLDAKKESKVPKVIPLKKKTDFPTDVTSTVETEPPRDGPEFSEVKDSDTEDESTLREEILVDMVPWMYMQRAHGDSLDSLRRSFQVSIKTKVDEANQIVTALIVPSSKTGVSMSDLFVVREQFTSIYQHVMLDCVEEICEVPKEVPRPALEQASRVVTKTYPKVLLQESPAKSGRFIFVGPERLAKMARHEFMKDIGMLQSRPRPRGTRGRPLATGGRGGGYTERREDEASEAALEAQRLLLENRSLEASAHRHLQCAEARQLQEQTELALVMSLVEEEERNEQTGRGAIQTKPQADQKKRPVLKLGELPKSTGEATDQSGASVRQDSVGESGESFPRRESSDFSDMPPLKSLTPDLEGEKDFIFPGEAHTIEDEFNDEIMALLARDNEKVTMTTIPASETQYKDESITQVDSTVHQGSVDIPVGSNQKGLSESGYLNATATLDHTIESSVLEEKAATHKPNIEVLDSSSEEEREQEISSESEHQQSNREENLADTAVMKNFISEMLSRNANKHTEQETANEKDTNRIQTVPKPSSVNMTRGTPRVQWLDEDSSDEESDNHGNRPSGGQPAEVLKQIYSSRSRRMMEKSKPSPEQVNEDQESGRDFSEKSASTTDSGMTSEVKTQTALAEELDYRSGDDDECEKTKERPQFYTKVLKDGTEVKTCNAEICRSCVQPMVHRARLACGHVFCVDCVRSPARVGDMCPQCGAGVTRVTLPQPTGSVSHIIDQKSKLPRFQKYGTILLTFKFDKCKVKTAEGVVPVMEATYALHLPNSNDGRLLFKELLARYKAGELFVVSYVPGLRGTVLPRAGLLLCRDRAAVTKDWILKLSRDLQHLRSQ